MQDRLRRDTVSTTEAPHARGFHKRHAADLAPDRAGETFGSPSTKLVEPAGILPSHTVPAGLAAVIILARFAT